jgi:hypothetical protein
VIAEVPSQLPPDVGWVGWNHVSEGAFVVVVAEMLDRLLPPLKLCVGGVVNLGSGPKEKILRRVTVWGDRDCVPRRELDVLVGGPIAAEGRR